MAGAPSVVGFVKCFIVYFVNTRIFFFVSEKYNFGVFCFFSAFFTRLIGVSFDATLYSDFYHFSCKNVLHCVDVSCGKPMYISSKMPHLSTVHALLL